MLIAGDLHGLGRGTCHPSMLEAAAADALLKRVIMEGDDEVSQSS